MRLVMQLLMSMTKEHKLRKTALFRGRKKGKKLTEEAAVASLAQNKSRPQDTKLAEEVEVW